MEPPGSESFIYSILLSDLHATEAIVPAVLILILLLLSALFSGSEVAYFSLSPTQIEDLKESEDDASKRVVSLLENPTREKASKKLLATILIANNFVNVGIILLSSYVTPVLYKTDSEILGFLIQVVAVTAFLVLFGEVIPKVYATKYNDKMSKTMSLPLSILQPVLGFISSPLVGSTNFIERKFSGNNTNISVSDLEHALEITSDLDRSTEEQKILEGIVNFGSKDVKQIMTSRLDVTAFEFDTPFPELLKGIVESGFSRIPVYKANLDEISGILYIKDLLPYIERDNAAWQKLIRSPFIVPENKKIDDLLREFQSKKIHMAIVVDEYGGTSGLVTLEDVIEEIVGDITDEFDDEDLHYSRLDSSNYVFEGKTSLIDVYRILDLDGSPFEAAKGDSDTLAGFVIEQSGKIPLKGERLDFEQLTFTVEAADKRKVKQVKITIQEPEDNDESTE